MSLPAQNVKIELDENTFFIWNLYFTESISCFLSIKKTGKSAKICFIAYSLQKKHVVIVPVKKTETPKKLSQEEGIRTPNYPAAKEGSYRRGSKAVTKR